MARDMTVVDLGALIVKVGAVVGVLAGGAAWVYEMTELIATKDYHEADIMNLRKELDAKAEARQAQVDNIEAGAVVQRINGLVAAKCSTGTRDLDVILYQQLLRYRELANRDFSIGPCPDGRPVPNIPELPDG